MKTYRWKQLVLQPLGILREVQANDGERGAIVKVAPTPRLKLTLAHIVELPFSFASASRTNTICFHLSSDTIYLDEHQ